MKFSGETQSAPFVPSAFWEKGKSLKGTVLGKSSFTDRETGEIRYGYIVRLPKPITVKDEVTAVVMFGESAGLKSAIQLSGASDLKNGDSIELTCVGKKNTGQESDMTLFKIDIDRPEPKTTDKAVSA